jgi:glycolate oxidase FAD binding subunit
MAAPQAALQQITQRILAAPSKAVPLRIRGGGSKDFYGQNLGGELLDTTALQGIVSYEPSELVLTAHAGTPLAEVEAVLADKGQCLPFEPPHFAPVDAPTGALVESAAALPRVFASTTTVGGALACGFSGPARASVGGLRDYVLGARFINGKGEHLTFGGQVMKNVAGYDISRLLAGSMGMLGVVTEISLKVLPVAVAEATLLGRQLSQTVALALLHRWGAQPLPLNASRWLCADATQPQQGDLWLRLRGAQAAVQSAASRLLAELTTAGAHAVPLERAQAALDWQACRNQTLPFFKPAHDEYALWRLSLPQTAPALDLPFASLIEWHGGLRWLWAPADAQALLREAAQQVGGQATLFRPSLLHGAADRAVGVFTPLDAVQRRLQSAIQKQFDPHGVFNTGRLAITA